MAGPRRCQSASSIRKKLIHAVEKSSNQLTKKQIDTLRTLVTSSTQQKPCPLQRQSSTGTVHCVGSEATAGTRAHSAYPHKTRASLQTTSDPHAHHSTDNSNQKHRPSTASIGGGFKSSTVQLEVELVERLNEIDRSRVSAANQTAETLLVLTLDPADRQGRHETSRLPAPV